MSKKNICKIALINILFVILILSAKAEATKFNMSYLYGNYDYSELVSRTNNSLDEVSPSYFDLYLSGNLKLNKVDTNFIKEMHDKNIKVVPFLSNHWDKEKGQAALSNIEKLTTQISDAIYKYNLDGINVDIENVTEKDRENYVQLVKRLREKLGKNKSISVAVAANPNNWQTGWHGSYDYTKLSEYADYLMLMTYDEHYESGEPGPVASIEFVEKAIKYAIERVDPSKIVLGIPFFGRYWQNGVYYGGYGISLERIKTLTSRYQTYFSYDEAVKAPKAIMTIKSGNAKPIVNGRTLSTGTYTIWYEDERSISAKLDLVKKYKLKGTGSWSLGQETAETWEYYTEKLNEPGDNLEVIPEDSSEDDQKASNWAIEAVEYVKNTGLMIGKTDAEFYPKQNLTRAEFATILARLLRLEKYNANTYIYSDTKGHWAKEYISLVTAAGYMQGYEDKTFKPQKHITREEIAKVLSVMDLKTIEESEKIEFKDVTENNWSCEAIKEIAQKGILKGYEDGTFKPKKEITREEIAMILYRIR